MRDADKIFWYRHREKFPLALAEPPIQLEGFRERYKYAHLCAKQSSTVIPHPLPRELFPPDEHLPANENYFDDDYDDWEE